METVSLFCFCVFSTLTSKSKQIRVSICLWVLSIAERLPFTKLCFDLPSRGFMIYAFRLLRKHHGSLMWRECESWRWEVVESDIFSSSRVCTLDSQYSTLLHAAGRREEKRKHRRIKRWNYLNAETRHTGPIIFPFSRFVRSARPDSHCGWKEKSY